MKRVFLIVLDSLGCGAAPDAADFGDEGTNTLRRISQSPSFSAENTAKLGLGRIDGVDYIPRPKRCRGAALRMTERSRGKDTTIGHWDIAGIVSPRPLPTYQDGFPDDLLAEFSRRVGRGVLLNKPYSGTDAIRDYGEEHVKTGKLIVYTSADSVFQIAAHEGVVPLDEQYAICRTAREMLTGEHAVGRVIARPFIGENAGNFVRTTNRHDFSLTPPRETLLDALSAAGKTVFGIGKIHDIFAGRGLTDFVYTAGNADGMQKTLEAAGRNFEGLCFVILVDFDSLYGHRQDVDGYAAAFAAFDRWLPSLLRLMREDDVLMITADHGCDPGDDDTDHTREYTPLLVFGKHIKPGAFGTRDTFADIAATVADYLGSPYRGDGTSFLAAIRR